MSRSKQAADRIRSEIPIVQVLSYYGYSVYPEYAEREQQFSCDLHGDGSDGKPSARAYPDSSSFHCFACGRSRDAITLVREKEGLEFWPAVKLLESRYDLPSLPWYGSDGEQEGKKEDTKVYNKVAEVLDSKSSSPEEILHRIHRMIDSCCRERLLDPQTCAGLWESHDKVRSYMGSSNAQEQVSIGLAKKVLEHVTKTIRGQ